MIFSEALGRLEELGRSAVVLLPGLAVALTTGHGDGMREVRRVIVEAPKETEGVLADPPPGVRMAGLGAAGIDRRAEERA